MDGTRQHPDQASSERRARFELLYADCHSAALGYVTRRATTPEDAADAIAEVFLIAWRRMDDVPEGEARRLWIYGVARRVLANQRRGQRRRSALTEQLTRELAQIPTAVAFPTSVGSTERTAALTAAFKRLSESDRELLSLEGWEELNAGQIAAVLGCSRNAARIRLHRARRRLAQQLARQEDEITTAEPTVRPGEAT
jgi:RNA polymerase sigma factor (sigma-70 family)